MTITLTKDLFQDRYKDLYTKIQVSLEETDEIAPGAPTLELKRQVASTLTQNEEKVKAVHAYVQHILTKTPKTIREFQLAYGVTTSERDVFPLLKQMQEHCTFFDSTVLPNMMQSAANLSHYSISVQANYLTIIEEINEKNLKEQLQPLNEGISQLINNIIEEASEYHKEALVVEEQIIQMHNDTINDCQSLTIRMQQVTQEDANVAAEVNAINRLIEDLRKQREGAAEERDACLKNLGIRVGRKTAYELGKYAAKTETGKAAIDWGKNEMVKGFDKAKQAYNNSSNTNSNISKMQEYGSKAYNIGMKALEKTNESIKEIEDRILKKCDQYPILMTMKTQGGKTYKFLEAHGDHILTGIEVIMVVNNMSLVYRADAKYDRLIKEIQEKTGQLGEKNKALSNLILLRTHLEEISLLLESALVGIEFMSVSWRNIVIDLNNVLQRTSSSLTKSALLLVKTELKTAMSIWRSLHERVENYRNDAFLL